MTGYSSKRKLYRSRNGMIFGVCQGIADWREIPVGYIRLILILLLIFTGFFPIILIYLGAGIFLPIEPRETSHSKDRQESSYNVHEESKKRNRDKERNWDDRFYDN